MDNLPTGWTISTLGEICSKPQYGWTSKASHSGTLRYVRTTDISNGKINWEKVPFCSKIPDNIKKYKIEKDDILVSRAGSVGVSYRIKRVPFDAVFASYLIRFKPIQNIDPKYIEYYLKSDEYWKSISGFTAGIAIPNVNASKLSQLKIPVAPLNEQRRIIAKLEKLLQKINACKERLDKIPTILKRFRQSILAAACSGRLTENWREENPDVEPATELLKKIQRERKNRYEKECEKAKLEGRRKPKKPDGLEFIKIDDSRLPDIPENWCWAHLQNLGELSRGRSKHRPRNDSKLFGGKYPFIQTGDVARSNGFIKNHNQTYNETGLAQSRLFPQDTLCITIAANIADTGIITYPACFPDSIVGFIPEEGMFEVLFAMYYVRIVQNDLQTFAPATAQKNINLGILHQVAVPAPPLAEQRKIVHHVEALFKVADQIEEHCKKATAYVDKLTQSILAKAFRGELVPEEPDDEPASELLKRIQAEKDK
ncbi:MAG: restriction endonuclease subunit S [Desulfobacterales bacterium]|nr:restriction endonuclease subunit S [Desulfobacterales bacterium]